jgi:8-oxo-dGTP diphosphatase
MSDRSRKTRAGKSVCVDINTAMKITEKVLAYVTHSEKLLVFTHPKHPEAGIQVPGGSIQGSESPEAAVLREAREETGLQQFEIRSYLGVSEFDLTAYGGSEILRRHFFHLEYTGDPPATWRGFEDDPSDGSPGPIELEFVWVVLPEGVPRLIAGQGALLSKLTGAADDQALTNATNPKED